MAVLASWQLAGRPMLRPRRPAELRRPVALLAAPVVRPSVAGCRPVRYGRGPWALLATVLVAGALGVLLLFLLATGADQQVPTRITVVEVRQGESLWELANRVAPESPPQDVVARIRQLNGMSGSFVHPGQPLLVPDDG
jgi:LysM domain